MRKVAKQDQPVSPSTLRPKLMEAPSDEMVVRLFVNLVKREFGTLHNNVKSSIKGDKNFQSRYLNEDVGKADMKLDKSKEIFMESCPNWINAVEEITNHGREVLFGEILNYLP